MARKERDPQPWRRCPSGNPDWDRDSWNGGQPTFWEMGWDGEKFLYRDNPRGRFGGRPYPKGEEPEGED